RFLHLRPLLANGRNDRPLGPHDDVCLQPESLDPLDHVLNLVRRGFFFHHDDHGEQLLTNTGGNKIVNHGGPAGRFPPERKERPFGAIFPAEPPNEACFSAGCFPADDDRALTAYGRRAFTNKKSAGVHVGFRDGVAADRSRRRLRAPAGPAARRAKEAKPAKSSDNVHTGYYESARQRCKSNVPRKLAVVTGNPRESDETRRAPRPG